jgi:hypothetical protein
MSRSEKIEAVRDMFQARCGYQEIHGLEHLRPAWHAEIENYKGRASDVLNILARSRRLESSDPRDRIFALLGISTGVDLDDQNIAVDCGKQCKDVCRDFAIYIMKTTKSYDLLSYLDWSLLTARDNPSKDGKYSSLSFLRRRDFVLKIVILDPTKREYEPLPTWVPNWDRGYWEMQYLNRTIPGTLEAESATQRERREILVRNGRTWIDSGNTLIALGSIIGEVDQIDPSIALQGRDELAFQDKRGLHRDNQLRLYHEIMALWGKIFTKDGMYQEGTIPKRGRLSSREGSERPTSYPRVPLSMDRGLLQFQRLACTSPNPPHNSVEHHLLKRGRKTAIWSDDNNQL